MKKLISFLLFLVVASSLFAIGFGYHVLDIRTEPEFAKGIFPSSLLYQFNFPMPDFISGNSTLFTFRLDNGLVYRTLNQDPDTGRLYSEYPELLSEFSSDKARDYSVHFDEFNLLFRQGFFKTSLSDNDMLSVSLSFGGRFERAYERLFFMYDGSNTEGAFQKSLGEERFPSSSWTAYPELSGDRSSVHTFYSAALDFDFMRDMITRKDGFKLTSYFRSSIPFISMLDDKKVDFKIIWNRLSAAKTLLAVNERKNPSLTYFSAVVGTDLAYRYIWGDKVPYYLENDCNLFGVTALPTRHLITDRTYINIYGPQIHNKDFYPFISLFHDIAFSIGDVINNTNGDSINEWVASAGFRAEFVIYNYCRLFYEIGYVYKNPFTDSENTTEARFGFSVGV